MANEYIRVIGASTNIPDTRQIGEEVSFYTANRSFSVVSDPSEVTFSANTFYSRAGTRYNFILSEDEFNTLVARKTNIYIEDTSEIQCDSCDHDGLIELEIDKTSHTTKQFTCPRCKGKGSLIVSPPRPITGISVFYTDSGDYQVKYRVVPPGSITSILITEEDILSS